MKQLSKYPNNNSAEAALCWSVINFNNVFSYAVSKRVGHYFWSVFFVMLMAGLVSSNTASATKAPYWEIKGSKEICVGDGYQHYTAHTNKHYKDDRYEWRFEKNDCGAKIIGSKYGRTVKVHPGHKAGSYKLICIIKRKEYKKTHTYYCYLPVYCKDKVKVDAGKDLKTCGDEKVQLWGTIHGAPREYGYWVGGKGHFSGGRNDIRTWYTPHKDEVNQGYVKLKLVLKDKKGRDYYSKCGKNYDEVVIWIQKPVYVDAGKDQEFCGRPEKVYLNGNISGCKDGGYWTKTGEASGELYNTDYYKATAIYKPVQADLDRGYADLKLSAKCHSKCGKDHDIVRIKFFRQPTVIAGNYGPICGRTAVNLDASFTNATSATWAVVPAADGTINGSITTVSATEGTAVFTPSDAAADAGTDVTLRVTTNDPDGPCGPATADVTIRIDQPATADAGPDQTICYFKWKKDEVRVDLRGVFGGSATSGSFSVVSARAGGDITNVTTTGNVVTATFDPTDDQIEDGSVTLRFSTNDPNSGNVCPAATDDVIIYFEKGYYAYCGKPGHGHGEHDDKCDKDKDEHYICSHNKKYQLDCKYDGPGGGKWSHNGSGYFENENSLTPTYVATDAEIAEGKIIEATYTPYGDGKKCVRPCKFVIHCKKDNDCGHDKECKLRIASAYVKDILVHDGKFVQKGAINIEIAGAKDKNIEVTWRHEREKVDHKFIRENGEDLFKLKDPGYYRVKVKDTKTGCVVICRIFVGYKQVGYDECPSDGCPRDVEYITNENIEDPEGPTIEGNPADPEESVAPTAARFGNQVDEASLVEEGDKTLRAYPNRMMENATIEFTLDKPSDYTLNIYDYSGRLVQQISSGKAKAGEVRKFTIDSSKFKQGLYYGRLITTKGSKVIRLVK